jgi:hypothetical protein
LQGLVLKKCAKQKCPFRKKRLQGENLDLGPVWQTWKGNPKLMTTFHESFSPASRVGVDGSRTTCILALPQEVWTWKQLQGSVSHQQAPEQLPKQPGNWSAA